MVELSFSIYDIVGRQLNQGFEPEFTKLPTRRAYGDVAGSPYYAKDEYGREYYLPVTMSYTESSDTGVGDDSVSLVKEVVLPYPVLSYDSRKRIVETPLTERNSTVKEYINTDGWAIRIRGYAVGKNNEYPEEQLQALIRLYELNKPLEIKNVITDMLLVKPESTDNVVITSFRLLENKGVKNIREYEMMLVSDAPFSLIDIS